MSTFGRDNDAIWRQKRNITAEIYDIQSGLSRQRARANASSIKIIPFDEIRLNESYRPYLVRGLIPKEGLTVVWGPPKSGKTFAVFDMLMHVALGWEYRGTRRVQQGTVLYCSFEGQAGLAARIEAFRQQHLAEEPEDIPFHAQTMTLDLVKQVDDLISAIKASSIIPRWSPSIPSTVVFAAARTATRTWALIFRPATRSERRSAVPWSSSITAA